MLLTGKEHDKLWEITKEILKAIVPAEAFAGTEKRINGFQAAYGTVCCYPSFLSRFWCPAFKLSGLNEGIGIFFLLLW